MTPGICEPDRVRKCARFLLSSPDDISTIFVLGSVVLDYLPTQAGLLVDQVEF